MSNRLRWYILGNLIGIAVLLGGIVLINHYRAGQEPAQTKSINQDEQTGQQQKERVESETPDLAKPKNP
jgi:hypothetical protein